MTTNARREVRKAMMALAPNVASKKIYGANLPQGLHMNLPKSARTSFQWKKMKQF
jgi:hypothetical protein